MNNAIAALANNISNNNYAQSTLPTTNDKQQTTNGEQQIIESRILTNTVK